MAHSGKTHNARFENITGVVQSGRQCLNLQPDKLVRQLRDAECAFDAIFELSQKRNAVFPILEHPRLACLRPIAVISLEFKSLQLLFPLGIVYAEPVRVTKNQYEYKISINLHAASAL